MFCCAAVAQQPPRQSGDNDSVPVLCAVTNHGNPVRNLTAADFILSDNGQPREISSATAESELPLTIAVVADVSGTQEDFVSENRAAVGQFLKHLAGPQDRVILVQIGRQAWLLSDTTGPSSAAIDAAVAKIGVHQAKQSNLVGPPCRNTRAPHTCGEAALWHGLYHTVGRLKPATGRKAIVLLSDGIDSGSDRSQDDVIEAAQSAGVVVYSLRYPSPISLGTIRKRANEAVSKSLEHVDRETGGLTFGSSEKKIAEDLSHIDADLRAMYALTFVPPPDARDGRFHKLEVKAKRGSLVVRTRAGYWAANVQ
jgi:VWFA-related protein